MSNKKYICLSEVNESNKEAFLQQESDNVSDILQTEGLKVFLTDKVADFDVVDSERTICINPEMTVFNALNLVANVGRQLWCCERGFEPNAVDCNCFVAGYLMYVHQVAGEKLQVCASDNQELMKFVNGVITAEWIGTLICGTDEMAKKNWISRMRNTYIPDKRGIKYERKKQ